MRNGKLVYYRKVREGSRVRSVYCGSGERGERAAREDAARRPRGKALKDQASVEACATPETACATRPDKALPIAETTGDSGTVEIRALELAPSLRPAAHRYRTL